MQVIDSHYYQGPNILSHQSGLSVTLELDAGMRGLAEQQLTEDVRIGLEKMLAEIFVIELRSSAPSEDAPHTGAHLSAIDVALEITSSLLDEFSERHGQARMLHYDKVILRFFLPCDEANLGWFAFNLAIEAVNAQLSIQQGESEADLALKLREHHEKFLEFAHQVSLPPSVLALARSAIRHGVPYYPIDINTLQLGQGCHGKRIDFSITAERLSPRNNIEADNYLRELFPDNQNGRIATAGITGSVGKTTTSRMVACILAETGKTVGLATTQGIYLDDELVKAGDMAGGWSARFLSKDPRVQVGVFELARGGLLNLGMGIDACDVGAVLNIYENHIGIDGIQSQADLALIKGLVVRHAREMAVLNADDPLCLAMREQISAPRLGLVSSSSDNAVVMDHRNAGGVVAYLDVSDARSELQLYEGMRFIGSLPSDEIPATWNGRYRPAITNALFAMTIAHGMGIGFDSIRATLGRFQSTHETNPGRMNFFEGLPFQLCITKIGSPQATRELALFVDRLDVTGNKCLMFSAVGNRPDSFILETGRSVAGFFDTYICSDWEELRGRQTGEAAGLLARGLLEGGVASEQITVAASHDDAINAAYASQSPGDLLVVATYSTEVAWHKALDHAAGLSSGDMDNANLGYQRQGNQHP